VGLIETDEAGRSANVARRPHVDLCAGPVTPIVFATVSKTSYGWQWPFGLARRGSPGLVAHLMTLPSDQVSAGGGWYVAGVSGGMAGAVGGMLMSKYKGYILTDVFGSYQDIRARRWRS